MIQVTGVAIRSNKRVILPKANWANVPTIFLWWNIISKTFAAYAEIIMIAATAKTLTIMNTIGAFFFIVFISEISNSLS